MKKYIIILLLLISCTSVENTEANSNDIITEETTTTKGETVSDKTYNQPHEMNIDTNKSYSATMKIQFFTEDAPVTVNNFVTLARDGYYDNVIFHRVISGFMIQGGDPSGTGHGDYGKYPGYEFEDELNNQKPYEKGIMAMANRGPNTNGSQFFIMHVDYPLPYSYTIFGQVTEGLDVIDSIAAVQTDSADKPLEDVVIESVEISES
jgi:cyclophilin family peptidyl-prolyl cis-trans isomerase